MLTLGRTPRLGGEVFHRDLHFAERLFEPAGRDDIPEQGAVAEGLFEDECGSG